MASTSIRDFILRKGKETTTRVKVEEGISLKLDGAPAALTDSALAALAASSAEPVRVSLKGETETGKTVSTSTKLDGADAAAVIKGNVGATGTRTRRGGAADETVPDHASNGAATATA